MIKKINNLASQLERPEQEELVQHIEGQYAVEVTGELMRDDIFEKVKELLIVELMLFNEDVREESSFVELEIRSSELMPFAFKLIDMFNLEDLKFNTVLGWRSVKDIVDFVEDNQRE